MEGAAYRRTCEKCVSVKSSGQQRLSFFPHTYKVGFFLKIRFDYKYHPTLCSFF